MEIFRELMKYNPNVLSLPPEKLAPIAFVGREAVKFAKSVNKGIATFKIQKEQRERWLQDGQEIGDIVLDMDVQIGRSLPPAEKMMEIVGKSQKGIPVPERNGVLPAGITSKEAYYTRQIASHPEVVEAVKKEAREINDIPTRTAVMNKIKADKEKAVREKYEREMKAQKENNTSVTTGEALKYLSRLREIVTILPVSIPKEGWAEQSYAEAKAMVEIILRRLSEWS